MSSSVHIVGWPRWMRDDVTRHPQCDALGIQQVVPADSVPSDCSVVRLNVPSSEAEFRRTLTNLDPDADCVVLSNGVDADGTTHESEFVVFRRLGDQKQEDCAGVHPNLYHFRRWVGTWKRFSSSTLDYSAPPAWLAEAESRSKDISPSPPAVCETGVLQSHSETVSSSVAPPTPPPPSSPPSVVAPPTPPPPSSPTSVVAPPTPPPPSSPTSVVAPLEEVSSASTSHAMRTQDGEPTWLVEAEVCVDETPPRADETTLVHASTGRVLLTLTGVLPPSVLASLAQTNSIVHLPVQDGSRTVITRVRGAVWVGTCVVDTTSWSPTSRRYRVTPRERSSQIAPRRTVAHMHRLKRRQFERR